MVDEPHRHGHSGELWREQHVVDRVILTSCRRVDSCLALFTYEETSANFKKSKWLSGVFDQGDSGDCEKKI